MKCNGCVGSPPYLVPLKEVLLFVDGEVGVPGGGSGPSEDAMVEDKMLWSLLFQVPFPRQLSLQLVERVMTWSEAPECGDHVRSWGAFDEDAGVAVHEHVSDAEVAAFSEPPSSGSLHVGAVSEL